jgi:hypothetical protein
MVTFFQTGRLVRLAQLPHASYHEYLPGVIGFAQELQRYALRQVRTLCQQSCASVEVLHGREYTVAMLVSIRTKCTFVFSLSLSLSLSTGDLACVRVVGLRGWGVGDRVRGVTWPRFSSASSWSLPRLSTPYTLHPTPYPTTETLHHIPHTPTSYTLNYGPFSHTYGSLRWLVRCQK